jgi:hypothetical protein
MSPGFSVASIDENNESVYSNTMTLLGDETAISKEKAILTWLYKCFPRISDSVNEETFMSHWLNHQESIE